MLDSLRRAFGARPSAEVSEAITRYREDGYAVLRGAISADLCSRFWEDVERSLAEDPDLRVVTRGAPVRNAERAVPFGPLWTGQGNPDRIIDIEAQVALTAELMLHKTVAAFLKEAIGGVPTCIQTLTYSHSSQQAAHSDKYLVSPRAAGPYDRETLIASWVALEAADDGNGALIVWPGSHRLEKKRLKDDFAGDYSAYVRHLEDLCAEAGIAPIRFHAEAGDVLFWHGDLVHGGGPIEDRSRTRKSLVSHYACLGKTPRSHWDKKTLRTLPTGAYFAPSA
ncbi:MAG: phytanoyl-CoA dioxygenase family protein [Pseudomonadota bacterium]